MAAAALQSPGSLLLTRSRRLSTGGLGAHLHRAEAAAAAFAAVAIVASQATRPGPLADADQAAFAAVQSRRYPAGIAAARAISTLAEPISTYPAVVVAATVGSGRTSWQRTMFPIAVVATGAAAHLPGRCPGQAAIDRLARRA